MDGLPVSGVGKASECPCDGVWIIGFGEELCASRQIAGKRSPVTGCNYNLDRRPAVAHSGGQLDPVHFSRHVNIGEEYPDSRVLTQDGDSIVSVRGFEHSEALFFQVIDNAHTYQRFVFDHQNDNLRMSHQSAAFSGSTGACTPIPTLSTGAVSVQTTPSMA